MGRGLRVQVLFQSAHSNEVANYGKLALHGPQEQLQAQEDLFECEGEAQLSCRPWACEKMFC